jgi:hypothetical protein
MKNIFGFVEMFMLSLNPKPTTMNKDKIALLFHEYLSDPNCWPELWISGEDVTPQERNLFISLCVDVSNLDRILDNEEKKHP